MLYQKNIRACVRYIFFALAFILITDAHSQVVADLSIDVPTRKTYKSDNYPAKKAQFIIERPGQMKVTYKGTPRFGSQLFFMGFEFPGSAGSLLPGKTIDSYKEKFSQGQPFEYWWIQEIDSRSVGNEITCGIRAVYDYQGSSGRSCPIQSARLIVEWVDSPVGSDDSDQVTTIDISGIWEHGSKGESWTFTPRGDGSYDAVENGFGNARGIATVKGRTVTIDYKTQNNITGKYKINIDKNGRKGQGRWEDSSPSSGDRTFVKKGTDKDMDSLGDQNETILTPGWDNASLPLDHGKVIWTAKPINEKELKLSIRFELSGSVPNRTFAAGVHFFDPNEANIAEVMKFGGQNTGSGKSRISREGRSGLIVGAFDFGALSTDNLGNGQATFSFVVPNREYFAQFTIRNGINCPSVSSDCACIYRSGNRFAEKFVEFGPSVSLTLEGTWFLEGGSINQPCKIIQNGKTLTLINERGDKSSGRIAENEYIVASSWNNLKGILSDDASKIYWANGTSWYRKKTEPTSQIQPVDATGSWNIEERGRMNIWQNGENYKVIMSWPQYGGSRWITVYGEGIFEDRLMKFRVTYASKDGTNKPSRYVYYLTLNDDNQSITGYYTENGIKMEGEDFYYSRVK